VLGEKVRWRWRRVTPNWFIRPEGGSRLAKVPSLGVDRQNDLVHGRKITGPTKPIIEYQQVTRARKAWVDPVSCMLPEELLIGFRACTIRSWVAPAMEEVAAFTAPASAMAGRFGGGRAVIDNPDFAEP